MATGEHFSSLQIIRLSIVVNTPGWTKVLGALGLLYFAGRSCDGGSERNNYVPNNDYQNVSVDLDCVDIGYETWVGSDDPNGLDADGDGWGCEGW